MQFFDLTPLWILKLSSLTNIKNITKSSLYCYKIMDPTDSKTIKYKSLQIEHKKIVLYFHRNFTTAHSTSATRTNFFIRIGSEIPEIHNKLFGYGECGLPPKKPGCYMSDINDCSQFMELLEGIVRDEKNQVIQESDLTKLVSQVLHPLQSQLANQIRQLLQRLQKLNQTQRFRAPKCCLQFALMDLLAKFHKKTVTQLLLPNLNQTNQSRSFYTASLESNQNMIQNVKLHLSITKCLKFKYSNDIANLLKLLRTVSQDKIGEKIIVDANCSWSPEEFQQFQSALNEAQFKDLLPKILYVEQPFDLDISNIEKWQQIKQKSTIKILADESFRNQTDIQKIQKVAHAVNIKTEKTGGVFTTLKAALKTKQAGLEVMFGSMCSTQLGCTQTFQFYPLAEYLDVDGALLIKDPSVQGGFIWKQGGQLEPYHEGYGLKVLAEKLFE